MTNEKENENVESIEVKEEKKKTPGKSYRATQEKHKEIAEFLSEKGMTQSDFLSVSLDLLRKETLKEASGDYEKDLEKVDELTKQMYQSISSLVLSFKVNTQAQQNVYENEKKELNITIEEREEKLKTTEKAFRDTWETVARLQKEKDDLQKEFQDYKKENEDMVVKKEELQVQLNELHRQLLEAKEMISSLEKENKTIEELTREKEKLQSELEKEKTGFEKQLEIEKTRITSEVWKENFDKITQEKEVSLREKLELEHRIKILQEENEKLKEEKKKK
ncbi:MULTISPECIES: hypothetical protein [Bacillus]|uniref:hypothetical protein n=1 Tax=Bacillus TaxID=1386 RepID=UPI0008FDBB68|nr:MULTISPECIES: hypothetical protein [Bacillus]OJE32418.1 hypothetical protein BAQ44_22280 [Bacillus mobilis]HDR7243177.1 hypothetical protein [Bacillus mobilis]HDR7244976.1 hypothetical protein [Bacillus mobilis]